MAVSIQQNERYLDNDYWAWSVWLNGAPDELDSVDHVMYVLDRTFHNPVRVVRDRSTSFRLDTNGWGNFTVYAKVMHRDGHETPLQHDLILHYPGGTPTLA